MAESMTRLRGAASTDGYGDTVIDWSNPASIDLLVRGVEPVSSTEDNDGRQAVITGLRVYLDLGADVLAGDRAVLRGVTYDVDGQPADWRSPFGTNVGGVVVALKATAG